MSEPSTAAPHVNKEFVAERRGRARALFETSSRESFRAAYRHYAAAALQALIAHHHHDLDEEMANSRQADRTIIATASEYASAMAEAEQEAVALWEPEYPE